MFTEQIRKYQQETMNLKNTVEDVLAQKERLKLDTKTTKTP